MSSSEKPTTKIAVGVTIGLVLLVTTSVWNNWLPPVYRWFVGVLAPKSDWFVSSHSVPGWLIITFTLCALFTTVQIVRWVALRLRPPHARLFRSLNQNEQRLLTLLAQSDYGLTEGQVCESIRVPQQQFLNLIDRLVKELRLADRAEPASGGAFWELSAKGRRLAAENKLFPAS